ncbi:MAG: endo alpha-1,4 polygalactosaminidase [Treponema sp.]|nr:endo alpha-1,4 polygalactosaminidase [Treponema sp.]
MNTSRKQTWRCALSVLLPIKRYGMLLSFFVCLAGCASTFGIGRTAAAAPYEFSDYLVLIGADDTTIRSQAGKRQTIVVDGQAVSADTVQLLHDDGNTVYAYLNIGSLETYRDYYQSFRSAALKPYDNWKDEYWVDVSDAAWQAFVTQVLAAEIAKKQVDGFFLDNADVYDVYRSDAVYDGLVTVLEGLQGYTKALIVNGGDVFVTRLLVEGKQHLISGINQECVFTTIKKYNKDVFGVQTPADRDYFMEYITAVSRAGCNVYLVEYTKDVSLWQRIKTYAESNGFRFYISETVGLDRAVSGQ